MYYDETITYTLQYITTFFRGLNILTKKQPSGCFKEDGIK